VVAGVALAWVLVTSAPFLQATLTAPPGRVFPGAFFFDDDMYMHLSFAEQAARGELALRNKFDLRPHGPFLVNLQWWASGVVVAASGGHPVVGFHVAGAFAALFALAVVARILARAGVRGGSLAWGLGLFCLGSGLGWLRLWRGEPLRDVQDAFLSLYPWNLRIVGGAHGLFGVALFLGTLVAWDDWRTGRAGRRGWILWATALGLSRPYELGTFLLTASLLEVPALWRGQGRAALARVLELLWLSPVLFYTALAFGLHPSLGSFGGKGLQWPTLTLVQLCWTFGPAALALLVARLRGAAPVEGWAPSRSTLGAALAVSLGLSRLPLPFAVQFAGVAGSLLLLLLAAEASRRALPLLTLALAPTSLLVLLVFFNFPTGAYPTLAQVRAVERLGRECRPGDRAMADAETSLHVAGLTACDVVLGHRVLTPEFGQREAEARAFLRRSTPAAWRRAYLAARGARFALVPPGGLDGQPGATLLGRFDDRELWRLER